MEKGSKVPRFKECKSKRETGKMPMPYQSLNHRPETPNPLRNMKQKEKMKPEKWKNVFFASSGGESTTRTRSPTYSYSSLIN
jgi:hypothetical protein